MRVLENKISKWFIDVFPNIKVHGYPVDEYKDYNWEQFEQDADIIEIIFKIEDIVEYFKEKVKIKDKESVIKFLKTFHTMKKSDDFSAEMPNTGISLYEEFKGILFCEIDTTNVEFVKSCMDEELIKEYNIR